MELPAPELAQPSELRDGDVIRCWVCRQPHRVFILLGGVPVWACERAPDGGFVSMQAVEVISRADQEG